ncbi:hypothetical protein G4O51_08500 [Candidatus Bathyarchaeota archaeon A05DMB-2]|jgi:hypothetical protein|nr:hypothetical protein [Candidatus Bathyarchaeota archaeon A05DMB-2]
MSHSILKDLCGKDVTVELQDGCLVQGRLISVDRGHILILASLAGFVIVRGNVTKIYRGVGV